MQELMPFSLFDVIHNGGQTTFLHQLHQKFT